MSESEKDKTEQIQTSEAPQAEEALRDVTQVFQSLGEAYFEAQENAIELKREELRLYDQQHKRGTRLVMVALSGILAICGGAMYQGEIELLKWILGSGLAVAAGASIKQVFTRKIPVNE